MRTSRTNVVCLIALFAPFLACAVGDQSPDIVAGLVTPQSQGTDAGGISLDAAPQGTTNVQPPASDDSGTTTPTGDDAGDDSGSGSNSGGSSSGGSSSGGSSSGGSSSGGSSSGSGSGGSSTPTTCTEARGSTGCCVGNEVYYCSGSSLTHKSCSGGEVCGWNSSKGYYYCVASPGGSDPTGSNPIACE
jgi:hypothetical protein